MVSIIAGNWENQMYPHGTFSLTAERIQASSFVLLSALRMEYVIPCTLTVHHVADRNGFPRHKSLAPVYDDVWRTRDEQPVSVDGRRFGRDSGCWGNDYQTTKSVHSISEVREADCHSISAVERFAFEIYAVVRGRCKTRMALSVPPDENLDLQRRKDPKCLTYLGLTFRALLSSRFPMVMKESGDYSLWHPLLCNDTCYWWMTNDSTVPTTIGNQMQYNIGIAYTIGCLVPGPICSAVQLSRKLRNSASSDITHCVSDVLHHPSATSAPWGCLTIN